MIQPRDSTAFPMGRKNWTLALPDMIFVRLATHVTSERLADHLAPTAHRYALMLRSGGCKSLIGPAERLFVEVFSSL